MKFEEAIELKTGSSVFDAAGNKLLVTSVDFSIQFTGDKKPTCIINAIDSKFNIKAYSYDEVFYDQEFLSDEEKALVEWISQNQQFVLKNYDVLHIISHCFLQGFSKGYEYKKIYSAQEQLQK